MLTITPKFVLVDTFSVNMYDIHIQRCIDVFDDEKQLLKSERCCGEVELTLYL